MNQQFVQMQPVQFNQQPMFYYASPVMAPVPPTTMSESLIGHSYPSAKERITSKQFQVNIGTYIKEGWNLYKDHWIAYTFFTILLLVR